MNFDDDSEGPGPEQVQAADWAAQDKAAWLKWCAENDAIMAHARQHAKDEAEMFRRIRERLGIRDFCGVPWGPVLQAKYELGYRLSPGEDDDRRRYLACGQAWLPPARNRSVGPLRA